MLDRIASVISGKPVALVTAESAAEAALRALTKAGQDSQDADAGVTSRTMERNTAEAIYDVDPTDANGRKVIKARDDLALAKLRQERAAERDAEARAALAKARTELEQARADHKLEETARQDEKTETALHMALDGLLRVLDEAQGAAELATKASAERAAAAASLRALEKSMGRIEPEGALERAAWDATREDVAPIVAILLAAEALQARALAMLNTALNGQRDAAKLARELGAEAHLMPACYVEALLMLARFDRLPEADKTDERAFLTADKVVKTFHPMGMRMYNLTLNAARLHLSHPHWRVQNMLDG